MPLSLSASQLADFNRDGFLIIPAVLTQQDLSEIRSAMAARVVDLLQRYQRLGRGNGSVGTDTAADFSTNITHLLQIAPEAYQHIDISLPMLHDLVACLPDWQALFGDAWRDEAGIYADASIFSLVSHPNIVAIAQQILGEEVMASPVQHVRIKPPQNLLTGSAAIDANTARTLWHQDEAVVTEEARGVDILTVWVAISDATLENGCMQAVAGSHTAADVADIADFGLARHCPGKGDLVGEIYIPEETVAALPRTPLLANAGDVVLLHKRTLHGAGANESNGVRWSFDMRYQALGTPSGREHFPSAIVASHNAAEIVQHAQQYRQRWLQARDAILDGSVTAEFNSRWNKYAPICA